MVGNCFLMERDYDLFNKIFVQIWNWMNGKVNLIPSGSYNIHVNENRWDWLRRVHLIEAVKVITHENSSRSSNKTLEHFARAVGFKNNFRKTSTNEDKTASKADRLTNQTTYTKKLK